MSGDGATTGDGLAAETLAAMRPVCSCCGDAATCFGESEGDPPVYACDNCCGHGGEDGHCSPVAPGRVTVEETEHLRASITARMCERLSRREPDWNDLCSYLGAADLFVASPRLLATVIGQRAEIARLTAALDGVRREERREPPTRDEVRRHHVEHGGYWLVSSVRVGHPTREDCRPMVLQVIDGEYGPHAGTPHAGYGGAWDDPWALMTGAEWQRIDRDGRLMADEGSDGR